MIAGRIVCKQQKTPEWYQARLGKVTASNIGRALKMVAKGSVKRGDKRFESSTLRAGYIRDIAWELITRVPTDHYVSPAMDVGAAYESEARVEYWQACGEEVEETGFVLHPTLDYLGCSPDGFRPKARRIVEIKVPQLKTHEDYLMADVVPAEYVPQLQCAMLCFGYEDADFVSYAPPDVYEDFPDDLRLFVKPLRADFAMHAQMEQAATEVMEGAVKLVQSLTARYPQLAQPMPKRTLEPVLERMVQPYDDSREFWDAVELPGEDGTVVAP